MTERKLVAVEPGATGRRLGYVALGLVVATLLAAVGGSIWASGLVESRLRRLAAGAGLAMTSDSISVSPLGDLRIEGLRFSRDKGADVIAAKLVAASLAPWQFLAGRRRPASLTVEGLRAEVLLQDGRPEELLSLLRASKEAFGRGGVAGPRDTTATGDEVTTAIEVRDAKVVVRLIGRFEELLPGGLTVADIGVRFDPAAGVGEATARVDGALRSQLQASLVPAQGDQPARIEGAFMPALRLPVPHLPDLPALVDAVVIERFAYHPRTGPEVAGVALHAGETRLVELGQAGLDPHSGGLRAGPIRLQPDAIARGWRWWQRRDAPAAAGGAEGQAAKDPARGRGEGKAAPDPGDGGAAAPPAWLPRRPVDVAQVRLGQAQGGGAYLRIEGLHAGLGDDLGACSAQSIAVELGPSATAGQARLLRVEVIKPMWELRWTQQQVGRLPGGASLWAVVENARRQPVLAPPEDDDDDTPVDRPDLAPEARRPAPAKAAKPGTQRATRKGPASAGAIAPIHGAMALLSGLGPQIEAALARLERAGALELSVADGKVALVEPAAAAPCCGLREVALSVGRRLGDGSRAVRLEASTFGMGEGGAATAGAPAAGVPTAASSVKAAVVIGAGGRFERAEATFSGGALAAAARSLGAAISVGAGATLGGNLVLRTEADGSRTVVEGQLNAAGVGIDWWRLAPRPIGGLAFAAKLTVIADAKARSIVARVDPLQVGEAQGQLLVEASDISPKTATLHVQAKLPLQDCGKVAAAIPEAMLPTIGAIAAQGEISADVDVTVPLHAPYKGQFDANLKDDTCSIQQLGRIDLAELQGDFARPVNESGVLLDDQRIGPASDAWAPLADLPPWVPYAMMATEDAAFYHHRGLRLGLLERAIKMNLDYGRFVYGGSTLTQQLVKNLYLTRDKHLGRKFEELLIVWHIERALGEDKVKTKDRIVEIYVNAVEFAPHVYGIQRAAKLYFGKDAKDLTPLEAAFVAANKPHPKVGMRVFESRKWTDWWQERMIGILRKMRDDRVITEEQFVAEAPYVPRFVGWPAPVVPDAASGGPVGVGGVEE